MSILPPADPDLIVLGYDPLVFAIAFYLCFGVLVVLETFFTGRSK